MKNKKIAILFVMIVLLLPLVLGTMALYAFAEDISLSAFANLSNVDNCEVAVICSEKARNDAKKAAKSILCSSVKLRASEICCGYDQIVCYSQNVILVLDTDSMLPTFLFYDCLPSEIRKSEGECEEYARKYIIKNLPRGCSAHTVQLKNTGEYDGICNFEITVNGKIAELSVRMDTGSVVYYDGRDFFDENR